MRRVLLAMLLGLCAATIALTIAPQVTAQAYVNPGNYALDWAEHHALNAPYSYGAAGPYAYDCSGLVMTAVYRATGIQLPHNAEAMVQSGKLYWVPWQDRERGDLLFWFSGGYAYHVAFQTAYGWLDFGASTYGWKGRVTWHEIWSQPEAYRLG